MTAEEIAIFSANYQKARARFLSACEIAGAAVSSVQNPIPGPDGGALFTDVAVLGPADASTVLILQSGTHGVEGFAGSAIQTSLLHDPMLVDWSSRLRLVFIHAINPWGFAHLRRSNEDNVDLNRNFVDHSKPHPENQPYEQLANILEPEKMSLLTRPLFVVRLLSYAVRHGMSALRTAVSEGQSSHPQGLFFGGHTESWSNRVFRKNLHDSVVGAKLVAFIDIHTGLGKSGYGELIVNEHKHSPAYNRACNWWGNRVRSTKANESVSADLMGTMKEALHEILHGSEVTAATLEFGTVPSTTVLWALVAENWLHHHGDPNEPQTDRIKAKLRRAFYTETDEWKSAVLEQGRQVISQAAAGLLIGGPS